MTNTIPCRSCQEPMSTNAEKCPHCGTQTIGLGHVLLAGILGLFAAPICSFVFFAIAGAIDPNTAYTLGGTGYLALTAACWGLIVLIFAVPYLQRRDGLQQARSTTTPSTPDKPPWRERHPRAAKLGTTTLATFGALVLVFLAWGVAGELGYENLQPGLRLVGDLVRYAFFALAVATGVAYLLDRHETQSPGD